ncbi:conjugal transfer pilus assembly protein TraH [Yersinia sp. 2544 StPb PI]|uniref:conjugal transfer pilus assembly protein TraH n=1 Tax=unclassified Yersinia (in: enterobacteria) TaxID=2653513 RepID=UPI002AC52D49|nr:conjugal transfer protein TraH [Yersinia enterocolitica]
MRNKSLLFGSILLIASPLHADVNNDLNNFFNKLGFEGNATAAQVWQGQAAGYATGGSLYLRSNVKQIQMISMTVPSINAGCGGIDAYLGAFSHINSEQLERFAKQIMANAAGYLFDLALQTAVPGMKQAKDFVQKLATDVNSMNMSSCQAAQGIIGGLWPKTQLGSEKICQDIAGESNIFSDWAASRQGCTVGGQLSGILSNAPEQYKDQIVTNKNLMWDALSKNAMFSGNQQLKEFAMSITGTLIFDNDGKVIPLLSLADNQDIIKALMHGGQAKVYACNSDACLSPTLSTMTISASNGLDKRVQTMIDGIYNKLSSDEPLSDAEKGFIESTSVPILKYLVDPQMAGIGPNMLSSLSEYVAYDILLQYLKEVLQQARMMVAAKNFPEETAKNLKDSMDIAGRQLNSLQGAVQVKSNALMELDRQMSYLRQQVSSQLLERYQQNYGYEGK